MMVPRSHINILEIKLRSSSVSSGVTSSSTVLVNTEEIQKNFGKTFQLVLRKKNKSTCIKKLVVNNREITDPKLNALISLCGHW